MEQTTTAMQDNYGHVDVDCTRGCKNWSGKLKNADVQETQNGNGVNWTCPECGQLVATENY